MFFSFKKIIFAVVLTYLPIIAAAQYRVENWTVEQGLPQNTVNGLLQGKDGFLWFSTNDGIVRFDGVRFKVFNKSNSEGLITSRFNNSVEDKSGRLWFRSEIGNLVMFENGKFTSFTEQDGLPGKKTDVIFDDNQGSILFSNENGRFRYSDGKFLPVQIESSESDSKICYVDKEGGIWLTDEKGLRRVLGDQVTEFGVFKNVQDESQTVFEDSEKNFWVTSAPTRCFGSIKANKSSTIHLSREPVRNLLKTSTEMFG